MYLVACGVSILFLKLGVQAISDEAQCTYDIGSLSEYRKNNDVLISICLNCYRSNG